MLLLFPLLGLIFAGAWVVVLGRPRFLGNSDLSEINEAKNQKISIVIPARDEERNIGRLLESIFQQTTDLGNQLEVIVVDDHSTDRTAEIAEDLGARVVTCAPLEDGWKGKPWACMQGAGIAQGDWLLFLDADTWLEKEALEKLSELTCDENVVTSICPYHITENCYEQLSAFFNVMMVAGSNNFSISDQKDATLFGQSLLISKSLYENVGGHTRVRDKVLENVYLSNELREIGAVLDNYLGKGNLNMRMFPEGFTELWASWKKGFISGAAAVPKFSLIWSSIWITGAMFTIVSLLVASAGFGSEWFVAACGISYFVYVAQCWLSFRMLGRFKWWTWWLFPVLLLFYQWLFFTAIIHVKRGIKTQWKGRDVT